MNSYRPEWVLKYTDIGFNESWADSVLEKYPTQLFKQLPDKMSPENFVQIDPFNIESSDSLLSIISIPEDYTTVHVLRLTIDLINRFGECMPEEDREIYETYLGIQEKDKFYSNYSFEQFYVFCRKSQYVDLTYTTEYKLLSSAMEKHTFNNGMKPPIESDWIVTIEDTMIKVKIIGFSESQDDAVVDPKVDAKIMESKDEFEKGDMVVLLPEKFNRGEFLSL